MWFRAIRAAKLIARNDNHNYRFFGSNVIRSCVAQSWEELDLTEVVEIPFEPARYDSVASCYRRGRITFAAPIILYADKVAQLTSDSTVLDLGCGPGIIANEIAAFAGHVIGVDPSEGMINAAREGAPENVTYIQGSSYDMSFIDRPLALVTFGRSFHWMNRDATLVLLDGLVSQGGCLAFLEEGLVAGKTPQHAWWSAANRYVRKFADLNECDRHFIGTDWERNEFPLSRSAFKGVTYYGVVKWHTSTYKRS